MTRKLENHHNLEVKDSNGIDLCQCHDDTGVLEIKCPYCHRNDAIDSAAIKDSKFCLQKQVDGSLWTCILLPDTNSTISV